MKPIKNLVLAFLVFAFNPSINSVFGQSTCIVDRLTDTGEGSDLSGDLRYCVNQAQNQDTVMFEVIGTINLSGTLPDLTQSISIQGPGADLLTVQRDTGGDYCVFTVSQGATVSISGLSIINGSSDLGGGIANSGTLTVDSCQVLSNSASVYGGGIFNQGTLTVVNSIVASNQAVGFPWSAPGQGGGISNQGLLTVVSSTIANNESDGWNSGQGGGIHNRGEAVISNSTIANNTAYSFGGGWGGGIYNNGSLSISNSTVAGNQAGGDIGGGGGGVVTQGICCEEGGVFNSRNTIIAGNISWYGCGDVYNSLGSLGHNLIGDGCTDFDPTDLVNIDPVLGPLQDNGGPTPTFALLAGSPAIDAGDNTDAPDYDQRGPGFPRIVNGLIDIGAFEVQGANTSP